jgi:GLPGLI family protein
MKHTLTFLLACSSLMAMAQQKQGTIVYESKRNLWKTIRNEEMKQFIPEYRTAKYNLLFNDSVSLYKLIPEVELPDEGGGGGGIRTSFSFGGGGGEGETYKNFTALKSIQSNEFMGKAFLIEDSIAKMRWKVTKETKTILGKPCIKATTKITAPQIMQRRVSTANSLSEAVTGKADTTVANNAPKEMEVVAWFAPSIQAPVGPEKYGQLPGAILELTVDDGTLQYSAIEIKETVNDKDLKEPKKGKKVTQKEYLDVVQEFMKNNGSRNGQPVIIRSGGPM